MYAVCYVYKSKFMKLLLIQNVLDLVHDPLFAQQTLKHQTADEN